MNSHNLLAEQQQLEGNQDDMNYENDDNYDENQASEANQMGDDDNNLDIHLHHQQQDEQQQSYQDYDDDDDSKVKLADDEQIPNDADEQAFQEPEGMVEDFVVNQDDNDVVDDNVEGSEDPENLAQVKEEASDPNVWVLPPDKDICTLEEIRRGQVINRVAPNECPVMGCGKKINEASLEPSPGTIASGLRTHVLFVHYANRKGVKKRKLGWSNKRRSSASPKKQFGMPHPNMHASTPIWGESELEGEPENFAYSSNDMLPPLSSGTSLIQRNYNNQNRNSPPGSLLNKKIKQLSAGQGPQHPQQSSLQSLMQATGMGFPTASNNSNNSNTGTRFSPQNKQKGQDLRSNQKNFNQTTSSLFSILAGLTQQPQQQQQQPQQQQQQPQQQQHTQQRNNLGAHTQQPRNFKAAHSGNTISVSQCSKNNNDNFVSNPPINSSLLSLLNEKISGNVASALHSQLRKSSTPSNARANHYNNQQNVSSHDNNHYNNGASVNDIPMSTLNYFIESVARKTGSNIGPAGVAEAKKIIEKFTSWLICSSQTIADHYIAPFAGEAPQQKPEISASDVILAYKMMQKSHPQ